ncbi:hypothetical protein CKM354_001242100 [Cercospora kikuchii]|uniref:Zn(2)-C6 fungal-type domain-containing protein n=1 Tax=Cercospora kikuchii TaxID=84275 RepID=A0A9P3L122_9PEZI|nr:uncharacterized protein CKM354_001242100 [Cercospora kikuchii]GIZ49391.1 hypothetical protein CKM354_001242100 [Cercospora kikuchii]
MVVGPDNRKRRAHTKSRQGCGNCKLRSIKCDETKPSCQRCQSYGLTCKYGDKTLEMQFQGAQSFQTHVSPWMEQPPVPTPDNKLDVEKLVNQLVDAPLHLHVDRCAKSPEFMRLDKSHLGLLRKFHDESVLTIGTKESVVVYQRVMTLAATRFAYAMHAVLNFTLLHARYEQEPFQAEQSRAEAYHGYHAVALFGDALIKECHSEEEKDALWATAAILGAISFGSSEATSARQSWPLRSPEAGDLDWLKMSDGKKQVWKMVNPLRETSAFHPVLELEMKKDQVAYHRAMDPGLDLLFPYVTKLYNLDNAIPDGTVKDPYREAASIITRLLPIDPTHSTIMWFLAFIGHMESEFRHLLEAKDPAALLLLAWWYAKLMPYDVWWLGRRCMFECQAICLYLEQTLPADHETRKLLEFPKSCCIRKQQQEVQA